MLGHVAQSVGGALPGAKIAGKFRSTGYSPGSSTFVAPVTGEYLFYLQGAGGSGNTSNTAAENRFGAGGGFAMKAVFLSAGAQVTLSIGAGGAPRGGAGAGEAGQPSFVDFPDGTRMRAEGGAGGTTPNASAPNATGGTASGGDVNFNGASDNTGRSALGLNQNIDVPMPRTPTAVGFGGRFSGSSTIPSSRGDSASLIILWSE